jgi:hypothetical protein
VTRRTAVVALRSFKLTWVMPPEKVPRDVLPPEGEGGEIDLQLKLDGAPAPIVAAFNARNYRRMLKSLDAGSGNMMVVLQGYLTGGPEGLFLDRAGFRVDVRTPRGPPGPPGPGGHDSRRDRPPTSAPKVEVVRRLK